MCGMTGFLAISLNFLNANNDDVAWRARVKACGIKLRMNRLGYQNFYPLAKEIEVFLHGQKRK
jgi:predicted metal-dependent phosphotriesterase family hydrolase